MILIMAHCILHARTVFSDYKQCRVVFLPHESLESVITTRQLRTVERVIMYSHQNCDLLFMLVWVYNKIPYLAS